MRTVTVGVKNCTQCGGNHRECTLRKFKRPVRLQVGTDVITFDYWLTCPRTKEPIWIAWDQVDVLISPRCEVKR